VILSLSLDIVKESMFKKRSSQDKKKLRRLVVDDEDDETDPLVEQIQQTKKRRKLLEAVQYRRGVSTTRLLSQPPEEDNDWDAQPPPETTQEGVLEKKQREAMEDYIQQNMTTADDDKAVAATSSSTTTTTDQLYAQLAESARRLTGKTTVDDNEPDAGLVSGTGLAEVLLPVEERLQTMEATARATQELQHKRTNDKSQPANPSVLPNRFQQPRSLKQPPGSGIPREETTGATSTNDDEQTAADTERVGFEAFRQQGTTTAGGPKDSSSSSQSRHKTARATDDQRYKQFVTRQREQRQNR
jgi:hypothetical protein